MPTLGLKARSLPNPFTQTTRINYQLTRPGLVSLKVYNSAGQLVRTLVAAGQTAGEHSTAWNGRDEFGRKVSAGVYLYRLQAGNKTLAGKMVLVR